MSAFDAYRAAAAIRRLRTVEVEGEVVRVTPTMKLVAAALADHLNSRTGQCNPSQSVIAEEVGVATVSTVSEAIAGLRRIGVLEVRYGRGNRASYGFKTSRIAEVSTTSDFSLVGAA